MTLFLTTDTTFNCRRKFTFWNIQSTAYRAAQLVTAGTSNLVRIAYCNYCCYVMIIIITIIIISNIFASLTAGESSYVLYYGTPAHPFQGCHTVWKFCIILSWWLSSCRQRSWVTTLHRQPDMRPYPDPQHLWWQSFCSCRSRAMEQFTTTSQRCAVTKDIFARIVGPRRSANYFNCAI